MNPRAWFAGLPREVAVLSAVAFCVSLGFGILVPDIPVFARTFGVSALEASMVVSSFALMRLVTSPLAGFLVDRIGERAVLSTGLLIVSASSIAAGFSQSFGQLIVLRSLGGLGSSMFTVSALALLLRVVPEEQRGRASGVYQGGFLIGGVAGPAVGGLVVGISLRAPFFVYGATLIAASLVALLFLARARLRTLEEKVAGPEVNRLERLREAFRQPGYRAAVTVNLVSGFVSLGLRSSAIPLFVVEGLQRGPSLSGYGFLVSALVQAVLLFPAGRMADTEGRRRALLIGGWATFAGMALLTVTDLIVNAAGSQALIATAMFFVALAVQGVAGAFFATAPSAVVGDIVRGQRGGIVVATYQMASDAGVILGPLVAGLLIDHLDFDWAFALAACLALPAILLVVRMPETLHRRGAGPVTA